MLATYVLMSLHDMPSIGTATGSRVDSAAKHVMVCKVDSRLLGCWPTDPNSSDPTSYMHTNKMKWCMHKGEIVLNKTKKKTTKTDLQRRTRWSSAQSAKCMS